MKKLFLLLSAVVAAIFFGSCEEETVSGTATYHCVYELSSASDFLSSDETFAKLRNAVLTDISSLKRKHNHEWEYQFEGSSTDNALKSQDKLAMSYYEEAVQDLNDLKDEFDKLLSENPDWGKGSFSYTYKYRIYRLDKTLAESDEVTFSYRKLK